MRVYVESYGCAQNQGEGHAIERELHDRGHAIVGSADEADLAVLVSCAVIAPTEARMMRRWRALTEQLPHVIVTGCLVPLRTDELVGPGRERTTFVPIREQSRLGDIVERLGPAGTPDDAGPMPAPATAAEEVIVAQGCTSHCTYCLSRLARGRLASLPLDQVVARVTAARDRGAAEIRLSSLDTSCWGEDLPDHPRLPDLLRAASAVSGGFRLRVGMMSPQSLSPIRDEYLAAVQSTKTFHFLHVPVQSGSDRVLADMRRGYTADTFRRIAAAARAAVPGITIATDILVGYPTETEEEFAESVALLEEVQPEVVNVTRFSPRPSTPAARLPELPARTTKRRSRALTEVRMRLARSRLESWIGWEGPVQVVEHGPEGSSVARLPNYLPVVLAERISLGASAPVRIGGARATYLLGTRTGPAEAPAPVDAAA